MAKNESENIPKEALLNPAQTVPPTPILMGQESLRPLMHDAKLRNIEYAKVQTLADLVNYLPGQIASKTLVQNQAVGITIFAIPKDEGISAHKSNGDAFVLILDGKSEISIDAEKFILEAGNCIVMPAGRPHAVKALTDMKMYLSVVF